ncbi:hypothetical protein V7793_32390, partial [Streptomyces sp. KLMMK]
MPAHRDADVAEFVVGQQDHVADHRSQEAFAVFRAGGRGVPEAGQVGGEGLDLGAAGQRRAGLTDVDELGLGLGQGGELLLPSVLEGAGDQPVLRFDLAEGPLGAVGLVTGALEGELGGSVGTAVALDDLFGGVQGEGDLVVGEGGQQQAGDHAVDGRGGG